MGFVIGMDEAGYGPNLGPLVLTATVWEVPGRWPKRTDFWQVFADIAERKAAVEVSDDDEPEAVRPKRARRPSARKKTVAALSDACPNVSVCTGDSLPSAISERLHIADSKEVYSPSVGLGALERGVLATLGIASGVPSAFNQLLDGLMDSEICRRRLG